ncbi:hypothetical protein Tco_0015411 [Tanacetum coccineum]
MEPEDFLIMGDENLSTIPEKESDKVIKSSVKDLVPIPSESEDTSDNDSQCDLPFCNNYVTSSTPLFDSNNDFTSSDDESLPEKDDIESKDSYVSNLNEPVLLVTPLFDDDEDECFDPGGNIDEIDAFLDIDVSTDIEDGYHKSSVGDCPDYEDSRARGFVHRSLELQSFSCLYMGIRYPKILLTNVYL